MAKRKLRLDLTPGEALINMRLVAQAASSKRGEGEFCYWTEDDEKDFQSLCAKMRAVVLGEKNVASTKTGDNAP